jgi:hypothetical protein
MPLLSGDLAVSFWALLQTHSTDSGEEVNPPFVLFFIIIAIGIISYFYQRNERQKTLAVWSTVAKVTGLQMNGPDKFSLFGRFESFDFSIYKEISGAEESTTTYTIFDAHVKNKGEHTLLIRKESSILYAIGKAFGGQDIEIDDPEFNKSFIIKSNSEPFVKRIFTPKLRQILLEELKDAMLDLNGPILKYTISGIEKNGEKMISVISFVADLCKNIDSFKENK